MPWRLSEGAGDSWHLCLPSHGRDCFDTLHLRCLSCHGWRQPRRVIDKDGPVTIYLIGSIRERIRRLTGIFENSCQWSMTIANNGKIVCNVSMFAAQSNLVR